MPKPTPSTIPVSVEFIEPGALRLIDAQREPNWIGGTIKLRRSLHTIQPSPPEDRIATIRVSPPVLPFDGEQKAVIRAGSA